MFRDMEMKTVFDVTMVESMMNMTIMMIMMMNRDIDEGNVDVDEGEGDDDDGGWNEMEWGSDCIVVYSLLLLLLFLLLLLLSISSSSSSIIIFHLVGGFCVFLRCCFVVDVAGWMLVLVLPPPSLTINEHLVLDYFGEGRGPQAWACWY